MLISGYTCKAQEFSLSVTVTNQTCSGNGELLFSVTNAEPDPPINYQVYLLPNTTDAIYDNTIPNVTSLTDGTYLVIATQIVDGNTVSDQEEVIIEDSTTPLEYYVTGNNTVCGSDGTIEIIVEEGNPVTYEILTGPTTAGTQESNIFTELPFGIYTVRVTDNCGEGIVKAYTVLSSESVITISPALFADTNLPDCDHITATHNVGPQDPDIPMKMPLNVTYTLYPPGGGDAIIYTQTITDGAEGITLEQIIPFYYDVDYFYDLEIIDDCGTVYTVPDNLVRQKLTVVAGFADAECGQKLITIDVYKYVGPYTIEFTTVPDGFVPTDFNSIHPGPFMDSQTGYGGETNPVPFGTYTLTVSDDCGRSTTASVIIEENEVEALASEHNNDCENNLGWVEIIVPGFVLVGGNITEGPDEYTETLPYDLSGSINDDDNVEVNELPPGIYQFEVLDECDNIYPVEVIIPEFVGSGINYNARPDCTLGLGSVTVYSGYPLTSIEITNAPPEFPETLPYDAAIHLTEAGTLYMDNLHPGEYSFTATTDCTGELTIENAVISGYEITANSVNETRHCGAFDIAIAHESNGIAFVKFWLQKLLDPETNTWGHPILNTPYTEGEEPSANDSFELENNETTFNLISTGQFRVIKSFTSFGNAIPGKTCIEILHEFDFFDDLTITDIKSLTCSGNIGDVEVTAVGAEPLTYKIVSKNGDDTFFINNGNSNIFSGLESATYVVKVYDPCGNIEPATFNVADLPSLVTATSPDDLEKCDEDNDNSENFELNTLDDIILNGQSLDDVTLTYHNTLNDAELGENSISSSYTANVGNTEVFARVSYNNADDCAAITSFYINVYPLPILNIQEVWSMCEGQDVTLVADSGYASYIWSNNIETQTNTVTEAGNYTVTVSNENGCETEKTITVVESAIPRISDIVIEDWTDNDNVITVLLENTSALDSFEYSINGINYQDSNTFTGLAPGKYNVYVRDKYDCGNDNSEAFLLTYPKFFTPNGDGTNEKWRINFAMAEPNLHVYIFDRYGKVITGFGADSEGWDGTYNNNLLPSTDYWFVVVRENGKEYKGHFAMIR
ncbi:MAG: hypothetical protein BM557_00215 [Flavobacterium sp. MedPE-SWcel]|nr:MAG: hypothetical protein BM557_00215 [Flavobacterium sp. MedPE-SWcel]